MGFHFANKSFRVSDNSILAKTYSVKEVIAMTGISRQTLYNWIKKGEVKFVKNGRDIRIFKTEIVQDDAPAETAPAAVAETSAETAQEAKSKRKRGK